MEDYSPNLNRQLSCACLDVRSWCSRRHLTSGGFSQRFSGEEYGAVSDECEDESEPLDYRTGRSRGTRWRGLWRRIVKEKRRIFNSAAPAHVPYDPSTYAMNFDEGRAWVEPENVNRSFSARFAVPSAVFQRVA